MNREKRGMESLKTVVLLILVITSVMLTFSIWTYTPSYETIEQQTTTDVSIAEKRKVEEVIVPYKVVYRTEDDQLRGENAPERIDELLEEVNRWSVRGLTMETERFTKERMKKVLAQPHSYLLYFHGEVPFLAYENVFPLKDESIPEGSFDRLVFEWEESLNQYNVYFINRKHEYFYKANVDIENQLAATAFFKSWGERLKPYEEVGPSDLAFIAVPAERVEVNQNTYYQEEIDPKRFRDALFKDPNVVRRTSVDGTKEEYGDDRAMMTVDTSMKMLNYVYPAAESTELAIPSELLFNTIDFINEHGGWTDEFLYVHMNPITRYVRFQLFVEGLPVYSDHVGATEIVQNYGENDVFRYIRPYYSFDSTLLVGSDPVELVSGVEVIESMRQAEMFDETKVEELTVGYVMVQDEERRLFILKPAWFYLMNGTWSRWIEEGGE